MACFVAPRFDRSKIDLMEVWVYVMLVSLLVEPGAFNLHEGCVDGNCVECGVAGLRAAGGVVDDVVVGNDVVVYCVFPVALGSVDVSKVVFNEFVEF